MHILINIVYLFSNYAGGERDMCQCDANQSEKRTCIYSQVSTFLMLRKYLIANTTKVAVGRLSNHQKKRLSNNFELQIFK